VLPSKFKEVENYPDLKQLLKNHVDMQFEDLRVLFRLPQEGLKGGCNFTAAAILVNLIAGSSVCFYNASEQALNDRNQRGKRFKEVVKCFYPMQEELIKLDDFISILYCSVRNPLAHSLGLDAPSNSTTGNPGKQIVLSKSPLSEEKIQELEDSCSKPRWITSTIISQKELEDGVTETCISVPALYWGVHRMLHALFGSSHASAANDLAKAFSSQWNKYVSDSGCANNIVSVTARTCSTCGAELVSDGGGHTFKCPRCRKE